MRSLILIIFDVTANRNLVDTHVPRMAAAAYGEVDAASVAAMFHQPVIGGRSGGQSVTSCLGKVRRYHHRATEHTEMTEKLRQ